MISSNRVGWVSLLFLASACGVKTPQPDLGATGSDEIEALTIVPGADAFRAPVSKFTVRNARPGTLIKRLSYRPTVGGVLHLRDHATAIGTGCASGGDDDSFKIRLAFHLLDPATGAHTREAQELPSLVESMHRVLLNAGDDLIVTATIDSPYDCRSIEFWLYPTYDTARR